MKKFLLSAAVIMAAMSVNAQEYCAFNADENPDFAALGLSSDAIAVTGGSVIGKTASITATVGADDSFKSSSAGSVTINDITFNGGIQGNTNPKDADGGTPANTLIAPVSGAFFNFAATADGYLYVIQKASSNKAYTVFENGTAIGYTYSAIGDGASLGQVYGFELQGGGEYNYLADAGITTVYWPEQIFLGWDGVAEWTKIGKGGMGVLKFPVFADCTYAVNANGSKMTATGFYFDTTGDANISVSVDGETVNLLEAGKVPGQSGIKAITADKAVNGAKFNVAGQRVNDNANGIIMINGKKYINK